MSSYQSVAKELKNYRLSNGAPDWDTLRRRKLKDLEEYTKRPVLLYAADFLQASEKAKAAGPGLQIDFNDKHGLWEIINKVSESQVDFVIHSPGGRPDAAESLVQMLRGKFNHIRFIIPNVAKSAATMMSMSGDEILMDSNAEFGPVDPQLGFRKGDGSIIQAPAQAIVDQFDEAQALIGKDPSKLPAWLPVLSQYGPSLYKEAQNAIDLSVRLVEEWLTQYMFKGEADGPSKAKEIARYLGDHNQFKSHGRRIDGKTLRAKGVKITSLESDKTLHDLVLGLYYSVVHTFNGAAYKLFDNSRGDAHYQLIAQVQIPVGSMVPDPQAPSPVGPAPKPNKPGGPFAPFKKK